MFQKAVRTQAKLRMTIDGPAGSGKTYTALRFAHTLAKGGKIAVIDTERGSASKYVGEAPDGIPWQFDTAQLTNFSPDRYTEAINAAARMGYSVLVIDSLSHAWEGIGGALEKVGGNVVNWKTVTPLHQRMVDTILQAPMHIITTMRSRMEHVIDRDEQGKVTGVRKLGLAPIQRPGMEYEFDLVADMDWNHILNVSKSRFAPVADMKVDKPGADFMRLVMECLEKGEPAPVTPEPVMTLEHCLAAYGIEAVLEANGGNIPSTPEEINAVWQALKTSHQ